VNRAAKARRLAALATAGLAAAAFTAGPPTIVWNTTASAPLGLYRLRPPGALHVGDWLAVHPPSALSAWLSARGYLPAGALLIKQVAALPPSRVCGQRDQVTVDGRPVAHVADVDRWGRGLPAWRGCRPLTGSEVFLLNRAPSSLDGRYFGPLPRSAVVGCLTPLWLIGSDPHAS